MDEGVADGEVHGEGGCLLQGVQAGGPQGGEQQAEPGDRDRERVEVDAVIESRAFWTRAWASRSGALPMPAVQDPGERAEQEVT